MIAQMNLNMEAIYYPEEDRVLNLWEIVDLYRRHQILKPPHQRDLVWKDIKRRNWIKRLQDRKRPCGTVVTYQLTEGADACVYLNDGLQRISTTLEYIENPQNYGDSVDRAEKITRACTMTLQHRLYKTPEEAVITFQEVNLGTSLTPYEFFKGTLSYLPNHQGIDRALDKLHRLMPETQNKLIYCRTKVQRERDHCFKRHDYLMLYRFISENKELSSYRVATKDTQQARLCPAIELMLVPMLKEMAQSELERNIGMLSELVKRETALMETIWFDQLGHPSGSGISITLYRWILECAILRRNCNVSISAWEQFVYRLLDKGKGKAQVITDEGHYTVGLGNPSHLKGVCDLIGSNFHDELMSRRKRPHSSLRAGYDNSHIKPFSIYGNGETIPEPAGINRARGARSIEDKIGMNEIGITGEGNPENVLIMTSDLA